MTVIRRARRIMAIAGCVLICAPACGFQGVNSLPLPGTVGNGAGTTDYHVALANVGTLEQNSPVMVNDVIIGHVGKVSVVDRHADVAVAIKPGIVIPANAVATVGQTSLLGSMHLQLGPPLGERAEGTLPNHSTIPLSRTTAYPSTEQTLAALSAVANPGGLGQIGDIIHNFNNAMSGRQEDIRQLLGRLDEFVGNLNDQRDNVIATITELNRFAGTLAANQGVISHALQDIPPALDVLIKEQPRLTAALDGLRAFSDTATSVVSDTKADLVKNLQNLEPTLRSLADVGPDIDSALGYLTVFPIGQNIIDRGLRGDYMNLFITIDLTQARIKRGLAAGTRWGDPYAVLVPAPGDPGYDAYYTQNPLGVGVAPPPDAQLSPPPPPPVIKEGDGG